MATRALWRASGIEQAESDPLSRAFLKRGFAELPLRAATVLSGGRLGWRGVDLLLDAVNHRPVPVARELVGRSLSGATAVAGGVLRRVRGR